MPAILLCTDFSESSKNALISICNLASKYSLDKEIEFLVWHLYELPASYSGEGIALTTIQSEIDYAETMLDEEWNLLKNEFPALNIHKKLITAPNLSTGLSVEIAESSPVCVVIGSGGRYSDLLSWDKEIIELIRELSVPVMVIPGHKSITSIKRIGFSCNLKYVSEITPFSVIRSIIRYFNSELFVLFIITNEAVGDLTINDREEIVKNELSSPYTHYYYYKGDEFLKAVGQFVSEELIDLLLVIPRKYGIWQRLVNINYSKELIRMDSIPVLALREYNGQ